VGFLHFNVDPTAGAGQTNKVKANGFLINRIARSFFAPSLNFRDWKMFGCIVDIASC
jgi:hypothetical protein